MASKGTKRKRTEMTVQDKVQLLDRFHSLTAKSVREAATFLDVSHSFLYQSIKNEKEIRASVAEGSTPKQRIRQRSGKDKETEDGLRKFVVHLQSRNAPVSGPILCQKAEAIATELGHTDFKATEGWFSRWKKRNGLTYQKQVGEASSAGTIAAAKWKDEEMEDILSSYSPNCIYNADETGIYFRALPDSTYVFAEQKRNIRGFKTAKERITALVCCNLAGDKEKLLVIGKSEKPRCFKNVTSFPTLYKASRNAWMTSAIWTDWLRNWNRRLVIEDKHILLLVVNCSAHAHQEGLSHITVKRLPPNTTSIMQPCDMGIIRSMKAYFRREMRLRIIDMLEDGDDELTATDVTKKINVLNAIQMLAAAWRAVTQPTVMNCWRKAGFVMETSEQTDEQTDEQTYVLPVPHPPGMTDEEFVAWVAMDDDNPVAVEMSEEEIDAATMEEIVSNIKNATTEEVDTPQDNDDGEEELPTPTASAIRAALQVLRMGLERRGFPDSDSDSFNCVDADIRAFLRKEPLKQLTMDKFFN
ncbi:hypothetical protein ACOMHN_060459 [Nucella lapillus]